MKVSHHKIVDELNETTGRMVEELQVFIQETDFAM